MSPRSNLILVFCAAYINSVNSATPFPFNSLNSIIRFSWNLDLALFEGINNGKNINQSIVNSSNKNIISQLNNLVMQMDDRLSLLQNISKKSSAKLRSYMSPISDKLKKIKGYYDDSMKYSNVLSNLTALEYFQNCPVVLADDNIWTEVKNLFDVNNRLSSTPGRQDVFGVYQEYTRGAEFCGGQLSPNYYWYNLYTLLISAEMTGIISLRFKYAVLHKVYHDTDDFVRLLFNAQTSRVERLKYYFKIFNQVLESARLDFRSCDPTRHIRDVTFFEVENLYQDILIDEYGNNYEDSCRGDCSTIHLTNYHDCNRVFDCQTVSSPTYCELTSERKRYQWIEDAYGKVYGNKSNCHGENIAFSWSYYYAYICEKCWCTCEGSSLRLMEEKPNATHVFSLLPSESNIANNMVVTGIRFIVEEGIVHIQIQEGQLGEQGSIVKNSQSWRKNPSMRSEIIKSRKGLRSSYQSGKHFIVIEEKSNAINLDDIIVPSGHIVTGIKFGLMENNQMEPKQHLQIQVQHIPFDFSLGELDKSSKPQWMSATASDWKPMLKRRTRSSEYSVNENIPTESSSSYIEFGPSSCSDDVGQTTIPFLDGVKVETISGPLTGIGLFYKGTQGFGGFLSFRLYSLNMVQYI